MESVEIGARMHNRLEARSFDNLSQSSEGRSVWERLFTRSEDKTVFLLAGWLDAWHQTLGQNKPLKVVTVYQNSKPVLAGAFSKRENSIVFAGRGPSDYAQFLIDRDFVESDQLSQAVDLLLSEVRKQLQGGRWFRFGRIPMNSRTFKLLTNSNSKYRGIPTTKTVAPHMTMDLAASAVKKKSLKRHENKLRRRGELFKTTYTEYSHVEPLLDDFFDQHQRRWRIAGTSSQFEDETQRGFVALSCKALASEGALRFTVVRSLQDVVAYHFVFCHSGVFTWYKPSFDPNFAEYSPGEVLLKTLIETAIAEDASIFDFTIGNEAFKHRFANHYPEVSYINASEKHHLRLLFRLRNLLRNSKP